MDYKRIISSRSARERLLSALSWVPDPIMLKIQYRMKFGRRLDLANPVRFTEKIQKYKLAYRNPLLVTCVDKYDVRDYVSSVGLPGILNEVYGVYSDPSEIDFGQLPESFVIKDTLGGGGNSVIVCPDKSEIDVETIIKTARSWTKKNMRRPGGGREWPYYSGKPNRILVEKMLTTRDVHGLRDYKFFCFDGKVEFFYMMAERHLGQSVSLNIYDSECNLLPVRRVGDPPLAADMELPDNISELIDVARRLSSPFPHVRVDLYDVDGRVVFGELTFYNASGYMSYDPDEFDFRAGGMFNI